MAQRKKMPRAKPSKSSAVAANETTPGAWERKGVAINLSQARRSALQAFATSDEETASPAQALYALIDTLPIADPSPAGPPRLRADPVGSQPTSFVADLEARLAVVERLALDNAETMAQCADSLEQIADAMEPMRELMSALLAERRPKQSAALEPSEWMRRAVSALGCSPRSELIFRLAVRDRSAEGAGTLALTVEATPVAIDKAAVKPPAPSLSLLRLTGVPARGELATELAGGQTGALLLSCSPADRGRWRAEIRRRTSAGSFGACLLSLSL